MAAAVVFEIVFFSGVTATTTTLSSGARATVPVPGPLFVVARVLMAIYVLATILTAGLHVNEAP
ncbi:hypothetical protein GCM10011512_29070 [Tersicoccus solisilvae]|uniref:Uncharacterized protein n=1 Tax=Tersicoccus solisilvae TaxID=1882339 RepID=A0ABQ1PPA6_9MICC|nr:hypothetical protein [Tersicoccus solisilvae]GGD00385.1 hypothetical protein GCM10011512_29070 [Tersicoccus solisilvae]